VTGGVESESVLVQSDGKEWRIVEDRRMYLVHKIRQERFPGKICVDGYMVCQPNMKYFTNTDSFEWEEVTCLDCLEKANTGYAKKRLKDLRAKGGEAKERLDAQSFMNELKAL